jgi:hypothetical protein
MNIIQWSTMLALLLASRFACCTGRYEPLLDFAVLVGAIFFIRRAVHSRQYFWAAGFVAIGLAFTPLALVIKIFLLVAFACLATFAKALQILRMPQTQAA